jgi:hypothetical protein
MDFASRRDGGRSQAAFDEYVFSQPRCKVCASRHRSEIDLMLAGGRSQADVRRHFNQLLGEEYFTANNISVHMRKHLSAPDQIARRLASNGATRRAIVSQPADDDRPRIRAAAEAIVRGGLQAMDAGLTVPEPRDVLAAAKVLATIEAEDASNTIAGMERDLKAFMQAVKAIVPNESWEQVYAKFAELLRLDSPT